MMKTPFYSGKVGIFDILLFILIQMIFILIILNVSTDIQAHLAFVRNFLNGTESTLPGNFLLYMILYIFSFISERTIFLLPLLSLILTFSVWLKYYISKQIFLSEYDNSFTSKKLSLISASLIFLFSIPIGLFTVSAGYYLGYFPPNVWHNSTTIFVMPFALLLYWLSVLQLREYKKKRMWLILLLVLINAFAKPSYLFVFFIIFPLFSFYKYRLSGTFVHSLIPVIICAAAVITEYLFIYEYSGSTNDGVAFNPLFFYKNHLISDAGIFIQFIIFMTGSYFFPLIMLIKNPVLLKNNIPLNFALISVFTGLLIFFTITETGSRLTHANFIWQVIICNFILFFILTFGLLNLIRINQYKLKKFIPEISAYALHVISGIGYLLFVLITKSYH